MGRNLPITGLESNWSIHSRYMHWNLGSPCCFHVILEGEILKVVEINNEWIDPTSYSRPWRRKPENPTAGFPLQPQIHVTVARVMLACTPHALMEFLDPHPWLVHGVARHRDRHSYTFPFWQTHYDDNININRWLSTMHPLQKVWIDRLGLEMKSRDDINDHDVVGSALCLGCCRKVYSLPTSRWVPNISLYIPISSHLKSSWILLRFLLWISLLYFELYLDLYYCTLHLADTIFTTSLCQKSLRL